MLDSGRIVGGIFVALLLAAGPAWLVAVRAGAHGAPRAAARSGPCVEARAAMLRNHPQILADWRQQAVRAGVREQRSTTGRPVHPSLTGTCLGCHGAAAGFCNHCHADVGIALNCWSCHKDSPSASQLRGRQLAGMATRSQPAAHDAALLPDHTP